jgi:hypothetical protein
MRTDDSVIAVFDDHPAADSAVRKLAAAGFGMKALAALTDTSHRSIIEGMWGAGVMPATPGTRLPGRA